MARVVLAMSGGVDSSVAAHLLLEAGHEVIGVFMRHGEESSRQCQVAVGSELTQSGSGARTVDPSGAAIASASTLPVLGGEPDQGGPDRGGPDLGGLAQGRADHKQGCCTASDAADARRVASRMSIPFYALDLQQDFRRIVDYFVDDYLSGRTPNPCVKCNHWIKFGRLFDYADDVDAEFVATGHYARKSGPEQLARGIDSQKDQSYALFGIRRDRLPRMLLPVGSFEKPKIREIAEHLGLAVAGKRDSQEICFVTQGHHSDFVRARQPHRSAETAGEIVTVDGRVVGRHGGYEAFTVGQRKGLGVAMGEPFFVTRIDPDTRQVVIGPKAALSRRGLTADEANWLVDPDSIPTRVGVQIRYNGQPKPARISVNRDDVTRFEVHFEEPQLAVAPGQAAVVYDGTRVLGGGWIE